MAPPPTSPRDDRDRDWDRRWSSSRPEYNPSNMSTINPRDLYGGSSSSSSHMPYSPNPHAGNPRRSRSPESRNRQTSVGGSRATYNNFFPDTEPGQIVSPNPGYSTTVPSYPPTQPRDPRAPQTSTYPNRPASISSYRPPDRPRVGSGDRPLEGGRSPLAGPSTAGSRDTLASSNGNVMAALENFSKTMHSALITTSQHALTVKHFARLQESPQVNRQTPTFEEAERRVGKAQKLVDEQMLILNASFIELMRRTIGITNNNNSSEAISALELDGLKERMRKIEDLAPSLRNSDGRLPEPTSTIPPPPPAPPPPLPAEGENSEQPTDAERKKQKIGAILDRIIERVEKVESMKAEFENRIDDVETTLMTQDNADIDREIRIEQKRKYEDWDDLENRRDPSGSLRGVKRKERDIIDATSDSRQDVDITDNDGHIVNKLRKEVARLSGRVRSLQDASSTTMSDSANGGAGVQEVRMQERQSPNTVQEGSSGEIQIQIINAQLKDVRMEVSKLSEQINNTQTLSNDHTSTLTLSTNGLAGQSELNNLRFSMNAISKTIDRLSGDVNTLMNDKNSRIGVFEQISSGVQTLAEKIQQCKVDYTNLVETQRASTATITSLTENFRTIQNGISAIYVQINEIKQNGANGSFNSTVNQSKDQEIQDLKNSLSSLQNELKEMKDGREAWTKGVMAACLEVIREENEKRKEDYAKIAKQEISKTIKDYMTKRTSTTPSISQAGRSNSEPNDNMNLSSTTSARNQANDTILAQQSSYPQIPIYQVPSANGN
ncbi:uncharacterized protein I206_106322 [Kwoniella pini CBS 10737]|uniref:Uncharacterized protein n=1 Tax=Kwoniella pini CBS 10737 TaxID=1296096 RepID=A0AAJ8LA21_9TREE